MDAEHDQNDKKDASRQLAHCYEPLQASGPVQREDSAEKRRKDSNM